MKTVRQIFVFLGAVMAVLTLASTDALAIITTRPSARASRGGVSLTATSSIGVGISLMTANQKDLNSIIDATGTKYPGEYGIKNLGSGYEVHVQYAIQFDDSMFGLVFRPSYFTQSADGRCGSGTCEVKLSGMTFFPILRLTPLQNDFIKFYMQTGVGFGSLKTDVREDSATASFSGSAFGGMAGIGVDFCFTGAHCLTIEGNVRYLPIERNTADSASGTFYNGGYTQISKGKEVEYNGNDLSTTLSGLQGVLAYTMNF